MVRTGWGEGAFFASVLAAVVYLTLSASRRHAR